jgi:hypothetical protein
MTLDPRCKPAIVTMRTVSPHAPGDCASPVASGPLPATGGTP